MKLVYVLTSSEKDFYYEQLLLSLVSLRLHNPDDSVTILFDEKTKQGLTGKRSGYENLVSDIKVIDVPDKYSQKESSRWIKTSIHQHVSGDLIFIDCDTIIADKLQLDFPSSVKIGAVLDTHVTLDKHYLLDYFQNADKKAGFVSSFKSNTQYNSGFIFYRDDPSSQELFEKWHSLWIEGNKRGCLQDQPSLNQANFELNDIISELGGEWNCQISHNGLPYLEKAKIIHHFATYHFSITPPYKLASPEILASIKKTGNISPDIMKHLENSRSAFWQDSRIIADSAELDVINSKFFSMLLLLRKKTPKLFKMLNGIFVQIVLFFK